MSIQHFDRQNIFGTLVSMARLCNEQTLHTANSIPILAKNNVRILPGIVSAALKANKSTFTPRNTIMGKGVAYIRPFDKALPLRPIEIEFENNKCCLEIHNSSDSTVKFLFGNEIAYFNVRSKGLVQANNSKHFPIDQYLHDRVMPATLSPKPLA